LISFGYIYASSVGGSKNKFFVPLFAVPFFILVFLMGYRYGVGTDYWGYIEIFKRIGANESRVFERFEPGFLNAANSFVYLGLTANDFLFVSYFFTLLLLFISIKRVCFNSATMAALSVIVLLGLGPIFSATNLVRQCFAVSIAVFFCVRFYHKKLFSTVASSFLGGLFHYSAPIVLILNFVPKKIISFRWWLLIVVLCFGLSGLIFENIFSFLSKNASIFGGFSIYFIDESTLSSSTGLGIRVIFEVFLFLFLSAHVSKIDPKGIWFFNITFFGVLLAYIFRDYGIFCVLRVI
jgi:hypothetical protein